MPTSTGDGFHEYVMMVFIMYYSYDITNDCPSILWNAYFSYNIEFQMHCVIFYHFTINADFTKKMCLMYHYYHMLSRRCRNKDVQFNLDKMRVNKGQIYITLLRKTAHIRHSQIQPVWRSWERVLLQQFTMSHFRLVFLNCTVLLVPLSSTPLKSFIFKCYSAICSHNITSKESILDSNLVKSHSPITSSLVKIHRGQ